MTKELVFEMYGEEIPARFQSHAAQQFKELFIKKCAENALAIEGCATCVTPQRLILHAKLSAEVKEEIVEKRGPRLGAPEKALQGFCASLGLTVDQLIEKEGYYCASVTKPSQSVEAILGSLLNATILQMQWPKTMRWPESPTPWVRPVRHLLALLDGKPFEVHIPAFDLKTTGHTYGHRFLTPEAIHPVSFDDYKKKLFKAHVVIDDVERKALIRSNLEKESAAHHINLIPDDKLLDEVAGLVEYPGVFIGNLDMNLSHAPEEAITTSMRFHQKCFAFRGKDGKLAPYFAAIINTIPKDNGKALTQGYEMGMLKARLDDARFFYEHDLKIPLQDLTQKLEKIIFHEKLGTLGDKLRRMHTGASLGVSGGYAHILGIKEPAHLTRAINLCKSDLLTQMVGEFAELQGVMGEIYALKQGESGDVAVALREYYQPSGPSDAVPICPVSIALALLDKIDTLVGFVGHGILPTGSKDPFALRRAALGVLRIILENRLSLGLLGFLKATANAYLSNHQNLQASVAEDLLTFFHTRFQFYLKDQGFSHDIIQACLPKAGDDLALVPIMNKVKALHSLVETADGKALLAGFKRACNIFDAESRKDGKNAYEFDEALMTTTQEKSLFDALTQIEKAWPLTPLDAEQCRLLASLKKPIDDFFDAVIVNDKDPALRTNRLGLLQRIMGVFTIFADFRVVE